MRPKRASRRRGMRLYLSKGCSSRFLLGNAGGRLSAIRSDAWAAGADRRATGPRKQVARGKEAAGHRIPEARLLVAQRLQRRLAIAAEKRIKQRAKVARSECLSGQFQTARQPLGVIPEIAEPAFYEGAGILREQIERLPAELVRHGVRSRVVSAPDGFDRTPKAAQGAPALFVQRFLEDSRLEPQSRLDDRAGKGAVHRRGEPSLPGVPGDEARHGQLGQG